MEYQPILKNALLWLEILSAIVALFYLQKLKKTYWIWFVIYLVFISITDFFATEIVTISGIKKQFYYAYLIIPIQFLFFYWLYALKSLKNKVLFWSCVSVYMFSFIPLEFYFQKINTVYSFNVVVGTIVLMLLVLLEFKKQIKNDDILEFSTNKMFYINTGVILFYIGTLPFLGLYNLLIKEIHIWNNYYIYFLFSNCMMYLFFILSFICGKPK